MTSFVLSLQSIHKHLRPYLELARYDKPIGIWLLYWPTCWGLTLAHGGMPPIQDLTIFLIGAVLMRGAGCTLNDMCDSRFDRHVERTQNRPLARQVLSFPQAFVFFGIQLSFAAFILLQFNLPTIMLGVLALMLTLIYPWMKRVTYWPQIFLGVTMNWGLILAFVSTGEKLRPSLWILYGAAILWTLAYDTIYAYQDVKDDALIGVRSSPLVLKEKAKPFLAICYGWVVVLLVLAGRLEHVQWSYYFVLFLIGSHFIWQIQSFKADDPTSCRRIFCSNQWVGGLIWVAFLAGFWI